MNGKILKEYLDLLNRGSDFMNKKEFLDLLAKKLSHIPDVEKDDIIN